MRCELLALYLILLLLLPPSPCSLKGTIPLHTPTLPRPWLTRRVVWLWFPHSALLVQRSEGQRLLGVGFWEELGIVHGSGSYEKRPKEPTLFSWNLETLCSHVLGIHLASRFGTLRKNTFKHFQVLSGCQIPPSIFQTRKLRLQCDPYTGRVRIGTWCFGPCITACIYFDCGLNLHEFRDRFRGSMGMGIPTAILVIPLPFFFSSAGSLLAVWGKAW